MMIFSERNQYSFSSSVVFSKHKRIHCCTVKSLVSWAGWAIALPKFCTTNYQNRCCWKKKSKQCWKRAETLSRSSTNSQQQQKSMSTPPFLQASSPQCLCTFCLPDFQFQSVARTFEIFLKPFNFISRNCLQPWIKSGEYDNSLTEICECFEIALLTLLELWSMWFFYTTLLTLKIWNSLKLE